MSDISIPGVGTSKYGTDKLIEGLMKLERVPRDREAERLKTLQDQKSVWLDFNQRLTTLRGSAQDLYSFKNPFSDRLAKSSNEDSLTATATREALEQTRSVQVKRVAAADRFLSAELAKDYRVSAGTYGFTVGDKTLELRFAGGSLQEFADALTRKGGDLLRAQVIAVKPDTKSLVVEALKTGSANRLGFSGDSLKLALDTSILAKVSTTAQAFDPSKPQPWTTTLDPSLVKVGQAPPELGLAAGAPLLSVSAGSLPGETKLSLPSPTKSSGLVLELRYRLVALPAAATAAPPPGPSLKTVGSATYEGITITGAPSASGLPDWSPPPTPPRVEDKAMANLLAGDGRSVALPPLQDGDGIQTLSVKLADYTPDLSGLAFRVRDTTRRLEIAGARIYDPTETGGYRPVKPLSTAQDALATVDGIEVQRPSNDISDVVPGVTLTLKAVSDKPVQLSIEPNRDSVKDAIIAMVGNYNRLMAQINILSSTDERLISEISYFTDDEKKGAKEHLGELQGDPTLGLLRTSLQRIMMNSYPTSAGSDMALLAQIGVATDASRPGGGKGYDVSKMRGYLEIDEDTLKKALQDHFVGVKELFGYDSQGTLLVDSGVAFSIDRLLKPYVETGGIISLKTGTLDQQITSTKKTIDDLDVQLAAKQQDLKEKYGAMEGALNQMQSTSNSLDNFAKNGGQ